MPADNYNDIKPNLVCPILTVASLNKNRKKQKITYCIGPACALWNNGVPFSGYEDGEGMCSIKLSSEAIAFLAKGDQLKEMGDRSLGGRIG